MCYNNAPFAIHMLVLNKICPRFCWQDDEPAVSPTVKEGTMEDVITATERESGDNFIEISVEEPQKVGDGMHSYLAYKWVSPLIELKVDK